MLIVSVDRVNTDYSELESMSTSPSWSPRRFSRRVGQSGGHTVLLSPADHTELPLLFVRPEVLEAIVTDDVALNVIIVNGYCQQIKQDPGFKYV